MRQPQLRGRSVGRGYCFDPIAIVVQPTGLRIWELHSKSAGTLSLGTVAWHSASRAYQFSVALHADKVAIFTSDMLLDIGNFCKTQTEAQLRRKVEAAG